MHAYVARTNVHATSELAMQGKIADLNTLRSWPIYYIYIDVAYPTNILAAYKAPARTFALDHLDAAPACLCRFLMPSM